MKSPVPYLQNFRMLSIVYCLRLTGITTIIGKQITFIVSIPIDLVDNINNNINKHKTIQVFRFFVWTGIFVEKHKEYCKTRDHSNDQKIALKKSYISFSLGIGLNIHGFKGNNETRTNNWIIYKRTILYLYENYRNVF